MLVFCALFCVFSAAFSIPVGQILESFDSSPVGSSVREVRAAPEHISELLGPNTKHAYLHKYGDDEHSQPDVQGYKKTNSDSGSDGYKHFDTFHKKDGDKYGYEKYSEYDSKKDSKAKTGGKTKKYRTDGAKKAIKELDGDSGETKVSYDVVEKEDSNGKKHRKAVDDYDSGYYADGDGADSEGYSEGVGEYNADGDYNENLNEADEEEGENLEEAEEGDEEYHAPYVSEADYDDY